MPHTDDYEWSTQFPFAPRWAGEAILLLRSFPVQICGRLIAILPTIAWIFICGMIPLALASICGLVASISDLAGILLCFVVPVIAYAAIVVVKVRARLGRRRFREDEPIALAVLDEATFLGWGITVAVTQMFRPLNRFLTVPVRLAVASPRAVRWSIVLLILVALVALGWSMLPLKFIPWANQYGRGVVTSVSMGGLLAFTIVMLLGVLLLIVVFLGFWAEMLALGGGVVFGATLVNLVLPDSLSWVFDPLFAWARWMPAGARPLMDEGGPFHPYLTGPGNVTPFGLLSMAIVFHGIPFAVKKVNVQMLPGEAALAADDRQETDNATGWWLRVIAVAVLCELPVVFFLIARFTALGDPDGPQTNNGTFVAVCGLAALGCLVLYRLWRTRSRSIDRPSTFVQGLTVYTERCLRSPSAVRREVGLTGDSARDRSDR